MEGLSFSFLETRVVRVLAEVLASLAALAAGLLAQAGVFYLLLEKDPELEPAEI
jgi:hypothetical protein